MQKGIKEDIQNMFKREENEYKKILEEKPENIKVKKALEKINENKANKLKSSIKLQNRQFKNF